MTCLGTLHCMSKGREGLIALDNEKRSICSDLLHQRDLNYEHVLVIPENIENQRSDCVVPFLKNRASHGVPFRRSSQVRQLSCQLQLLFEEIEEAERPLRRSEKSLGVKKSRSMFAQNALKPEEVQRHFG